IATNHARDLIDANETGCLEPICQLRGIGRGSAARDPSVLLQLIRNQGDRKRLILSNNRADGRSTAGLPLEGETGKTSIPVSDDPGPPPSGKDRADQLPPVRTKGRCIQLTNSLEIGE